MTIERKAFQIKGASLSDNRITGGAAVMGNMDRGDDVLFPGAFRKSLDGFLKDGFVAVGHDWHDLPVAMPMTAREEGRSLYTEATFHSTQRGQDARTVAKERIEAGLSVGLSIGFDMRSNGYKWFESGEELLTFATETLRMDTSLFDVATITAHQDYCRGIWEIGTLYEYSIVPVPMNPDAVATHAKGGGSIKTEREFERFLRDAGFSRKQAVALTADGFKALQRDADERPQSGGEPGEKSGDAPSAPSSTSTETLRIRTEFARLQSRLRTLEAV